jgi:hypothetical protein
LPQEVNSGFSASTVKVSRTEWYHLTPGKYHKCGLRADSWFMSMSIATLAWIAPSTTNTGEKTSENRSKRTANAEITGSKLTEDKGEAMVGTALLSTS